MKISDLNIKITFQKKSVEYDEDGIGVSNWEDFYHCHAYASFQGKGEEIFVGMEVDHSEIAFTVRHQRKLEKLDTDGYRIVFHNEIYNILSIDHMNYKRRYLKFRCKKVMR